MSWNDGDPVDIEATLESALDEDGAAAEPSVGDAGDPAEDAAAAAIPAAAEAADEADIPAAADAEERYETQPADAGAPAPHGDGDDNCAICQLDLKEDPDDSGNGDVQLSILPCLHKFHKCCIDETCRVLSQPVATLECPTCRRTPQDIRTMEETLISEGLARRVAEELPHRAKAAQMTRQLQLDAMFGAAVAGTAKVHGQRCAGLINL